MFPSEINAGNCPLRYGREARDKLRAFSNTFEDPEK
jgi:hypothetical protein